MDDATAAFIDNDDDLKALLKKRDAAELAHVKARAKYEEAEAKRAAIYTEFAEAFKAKYEAR